MKSGIPDDTPSFSKRISKDETFTEGLIQSLTQMEITHLYVLSQERIKFTKSFSHQILTKLQDKNLPLKERVQATDLSYGIVSSMLKKGYLDEETTQMVQTTSESILSICSRGDMTSKELVDHLTSLRATNLFKRVVLITFLTGGAVKKMRSQIRNVEDYLRKLCYAAMFHDILLESETQVVIRSQAQLDRANYTAEQKELILEHPKRTYELVKGIKGCPDGAENIILEHHGDLTGKNFLMAPNENIGYLSSVFMACEAYADEILNRSLSTLPISYEEVVSSLP